MTAIATKAVPMQVRKVEQVSTVWPTLKIAVQIRKKESEG